MCVSQFYVYVIIYTFFFGNTNMYVHKNRWGTATLTLSCDDLMIRLEYNHTANNVRICVHTNTHRDYTLLYTYIS